jgi:hypothetical protein
LNPPASAITQNALRPYLEYGNICMRDHGDNSNYNSMQMTVSRRVTSGLSLTQAAHTEPIEGYNVAAV